MELLILQLSDIHLKSNTDPVFQKSDEICKAIRSRLKEYEACFVVFTGDISYSGSREEYEAAIDFVTILDQELKAIPTISTHEFLFIPGNHDCHHAGPNRTREALTKALLAKPDDFDTEMLEQCLKVQEEFYNFNTFFVEEATNTSTEKLIHSRTFNVAGHNIVFDLLNTAWLSKVHEEPGKLLGPPRQILESHPPVQTFSLRVCALHHPTHWLKPETIKPLHSFLETNADIILTGHEHEQGQFFRGKHGQIGSDYLPGGVLQDSHKPEVSSFNIIEASLDSKSYSVFEAVWDGNCYSETQTSREMPFKRAGVGSRKNFALTDSFYTSYLKNPGAQFTHPRKETINFDDLYTPPDFRKFSNRMSEKNAASKTLPGARAFSEIQEGNLCIISGNEKVGKTSATKHLFWQFYINELSPLIINGDSIKSTKPEAIVSILKKAFVDQYATDKKFSDYSSLNRSERVLFIDDFHQAQLNITGRKSFLEYVEKFFEKVIIVGDDTLRIEQLSGDVKHRELFKEYTHYQILEFGFLLREKLASRWILIGSEESLDEIDYTAELKRRTGVISTILGKSVVPAYPLFILVILQQMEAGVATKTATGSFGYFYETLITESLAAFVQPRDIDTYYNLIAELAFKLFEDGTRTITRESFVEFVTYYNSTYRLFLKAEDVEKRLTSSHVLFVRGREQLRFQYKYVYYYFVARHSAHNLEVEERNSLIQRCVGSLHTERSANILVFLSYLSRDSLIIRFLLEGAKEIYRDVLPCDFGSHVSEISKLQERVPKFLLPVGDPDTRRQESLEIQDANLVRTDHNGVLAYDEDKDDNGDSAVDEILAVNRAFKTMQVLGQVVRNFAGSLKGDAKADLTTECISVGLRSINYLFGLLQENVEGLVSFVADRLKERASSTSNEHLRKRAKLLIFFLCEGAASGLTRRIATEIGSPDLALTYKEIIEKDPTAANLLIDVAIKMDYRVDFPSDEVVGLYETLDGNIFARAVLCELVATHFYLFRVPIQTRQHVCSHLSINISEEKVQDLSRKRLGHTS